MPWTKEQKSEYYHNWYLEHREERLAYFHDYGIQKRKKLGKFEPCACGCRRHYRERHYRPMIDYDPNLLLAVCMHCRFEATGRTERELRANWNKLTKINKLNYKENTK